LYNKPKWPQYQGLIDTYGLSTAPPTTINKTVHIGSVVNKLVRHTLANPE
jgi:hypothetical protein